MNNSSFEKVLPIVFLILGILGVYFSSFWWILLLIILATGRWIFITRATADVSEVIVLELFVFLELAAKYTVTFFAAWIFFILLPALTFFIVFLIGIYIGLKIIWENQKKLKKISENSSPLK